jgi:hypothetical protein
MRARIGSIAAVALVSCQTPPPEGGFETSFKLCAQLSEWGLGVPSFETLAGRGDEECVSRPPASAGATTAWSDWAYDKNGYDPDGLRLRVEKLAGGIPTSKLIPRPPDTHITHDVDFRLLIQLIDAGAEGTIQVTPWASEGGGWSPYALDSNGYDFDGLRVGIETRPAPGFVVWDMRIGVRVADDAGQVEGQPEYSSWLLGAYASVNWPAAVNTGWAADPDKYDPDAVCIYLETMQGAPAESPSDFMLCVQVADQIPALLYEAGPMECTPWATTSIGTMWSDWAYDPNQEDPDGVRLKLTEHFPSPTFVLRDVDARLLIQLTDASEGAGEIQATPWASEGGGWSSYALDPNGYDFDGVRVGIETKAAPGLQIDTLRIGLRVADQSGAVEGSPKVLFSPGGGMTDWATDPGQYDPDAVAIFMETTTSAVP